VFKEGVLRHMSPAIAARWLFGITDGLTQHSLVAGGLLVQVTGLIAWRLIELRRQRQNLGLAVVFWLLAGNNVTDSMRLGRKGELYVRAQGVDHSGMDQHASGGRVGKHSRERGRSSPRENAERKGSRGRSPMVQPPDFEAEQRELFQAVFDTLVGVLSRRTRDREAAEDAAQEAFARAIKRWSKFRRYQHKLGWLIRVGTNYHSNQQRDHARREGARGLNPSPTDEPAQAETDETVENCDRLEAALSGLRRSEREALLLKLSGLGVSEIASKMQVNRQTAARYLQHAFDKIRPFFTE
jgi:RNA polymerase sigma factor (sigma-70 family)